jgi:mono/diheme cytochrome c family protein
MMDGNSTRRMRVTVAIGGTALVMLLGTAMEAQGPRQATPPLVPESLVGSVSFDLYCASCHGRLGKGDGPTAASLRTRPADLTVLARNNRGVFPRERVLSFVEGSARTDAHGTSDMPVWGPTLRGLDASDARVTVRLQNVVAFIESLQQAASPATVPAPAADGPLLFHSYCAPCHGTAGRGDGVMAGQLRRVPPNLTMFSARNGGVFPAERVRRVIDGTGVPAHGDREMPVWGAVFKRLPVGGADAQARIDAVVRYLQEIQERPAE